MAQKITRSVILLAFIGAFFFYYYWSSPATDMYNVRLLQDGQLLDLDLSGTQMQDILKTSETLQRSTEKSPTASARRPELRNTTPSDFEGLVVINNKVYTKGDPLPKKKLKAPALKPTMGRSLKRMDFGDFKGEERKFMERRRKEFLERASRVGSMCKARSKLIVSRPVNLIWDLKRQPSVVWCPNHQEASSSRLLKSLRPPRRGEDPQEDADGGEGGSEGERGRDKIS
ncbi:uncharacterized protein LOC122263878 [Penaeus japonicus]|uniref:uncharacterized protein LOC122263878 n=1 Tax=Penaeus japonicus TaxID=27405 RepID=UPI001C70D766|nr:uncharacterized protein LOC122263878 [Penaeus japonicus]